MANYDKRIFARNLNYYLQAFGKSQTDLSLKLEVSKSAVSNWCAGQKLPRMDKIQQLADYFGIAKSDLIENKQATDMDTPLQNEDLKQLLIAFGRLSPAQQKLALISLENILKQQEQPTQL